MPARSKDGTDGRPEIVAIQSHHLQLKAFAKPHVERGVQYLRERFFKGGSFRDLEDCREQPERWCREIAGLRVHGTTRHLPREVFEAEE